MNPGPTWWFLKTVLFDVELTIISQRVLFVVQMLLEANDLVLM